MAWIFPPGNLKVGDQVWHQRCRGDLVLATVAEICFTSETCWVEYSLSTGEKRRSLLRLAELQLRNQVPMSLDFEETDPCDAFPAREAFPEEVAGFQETWRQPTPRKHWMEQERCRIEAQAELQQLEHEKREAEEHLEREFQEEQEELQLEQRERWTRLLDTQDKTLLNTVADIKKNMEVLKDQLVANHQDIEVVFSEYQNLFEERDDIDKARGDFEKEHLASHQRLIDRAQDLSRADAEDIIHQETLGLIQDEDIQLRVFALHKEHFEYFAETSPWSSRRRIDLKDVELFKEDDDGITLQLIGGHRMDLKMSAESKDQWLNALQPWLKGSKDEAIATEDDPPLCAPCSQPPSSMQKAQHSVLEVGATTMNSLRSAAGAAVDSNSPTVSLAAATAVPFVDLLSAGAMAVQAASAVSRRKRRSSERSQNEGPEAIPSSF